jgi:plasmid maintenance system killer protein
LTAGSAALSKNGAGEAIFRGEFVKGVDGKIQQRAREKKLKYLDAAATLRDVAVPPGNQLEALKGDRKGQHSIRINQSPMAGIRGPRRPLSITL